MWIACSTLSFGLQIHCTSAAPYGSFTYGQPPIIDPFLASGKAASWAYLEKCTRLLLCSTSSFFLVFLLPLTHMVCFCILHLGFVESSECLPATVQSSACKWQMLSFWTPWVLSIVILLSLLFLSTIAQINKKGELEEVQLSCETPFKSSKVIRMAEILFEWVLGRNILPIPRTSGRHSLKMEILSNSYFLHSCWPSFT